MTTSTIEFKTYFKIPFSLCSVDGGEIILPGDIFLWNFTSSWCLGWKRGPKPHVDVNLKCTVILSHLSAYLALSQSPYPVYVFFLTDERHVVLINRDLRRVFFSCPLGGRRLARYAEQLPRTAQIIHRRTFLRQDQFFLNDFWNSHQSFKMQTPLPCGTSKQRNYFFYTTQSKSF